MTEENKKNILNYITNSIEQGIPVDKEIIKEKIEGNRNSWEEYLPSNWNNFRFEGLIAPSELTSNYTVLYGGYIEYGETQTDSNAKGIILLLDSDFRPVKTFFQYHNGTALRFIQKMEQSDDGTFYMIDDTNFAPTRNTLGLTSTKRFVMLNNFTNYNVSSNAYELHLRRSYILPSSCSSIYCQYITKNPNSAHYALIGITPKQQIQAVSLKVNVGSSNDWQTYSTASGFNRYCGAIASFDNNDDMRFRIIFYLWEDNNKSLSQMYKNYSDTTHTISNFYTFDTTPWISAVDYNNQLSFQSFDVCYFVINTQILSGETDRTLKLCKYDFSSSQINTVYQKTFDQQAILHEFIILYSLNGDIYIQFNNNIDTTLSKADYYFQRLKNDVWDPILVSQQKGFIASQRNVFVKQNFNLLQVYLYATNPRKSTWFQCLIKENYNPLNYNGEPYTDYNSVLPQQAEVYHNNSIVFARNLYNKTINENQTNSTVVMPNTYLNNIDLVPQILLSQTNSQMVINNNPINKNIYETLYMNFINTINVINEDTGAIYPRTASYINQNINVGTQNNCESSSVGKVRINANNGSAIETITWNDIDDTHKQTEFALQVNNTINSIELISNDELTTYVTIDTSELETGKTYNISQKLRIE